MGEPINRQDDYIKDKCFCLHWEKNIILISIGDIEKSDVWQAGGVFYTNEPVPSILF